jgi:hypothetical protein
VQTGERLTERQKKRALSPVGSIALLSDLFPICGCMTKIDPSPFSLSVCIGLLCMGVGVSVNIPNNPAILQQCTLNQLICAVDKLVQDCCRILDEYIISNFELLGRSANKYFEQSSV